VGGYFDWTHLGIDRVALRTLRDELPRQGWRIAQLTTHRVWDGDADPTRATLREWWAADARFRRLLTERDLGDLITCIAVEGMRSSRRWAGTTRTASVEPRYTWRDYVAACAPPGHEVLVAAPDPTHDRERRLRT